MSYPGTSIKYMFDKMRPDTRPGTATLDHPSAGSAPPSAGSAPPSPGPAPGPGPGPDPGLVEAVPLERLEAQICELAGHLAAATCRFLVLLGDFDARRGWASWEMNSCAEWLSWKCQMGSGAAREHVRVARALRDLPVLRAEFGAGRLSYAKVRALTRIATPDTESGLAEIAGPMTGNQLERFARAHRQVTHADDASARVRRRLTWRFEDDGSLAGTFRLPPLQGAVLLQALRAAAGDLEHPHRGHDGGEGVPALPAPGQEQPGPGDPPEPGEPAAADDPRPTAPVTSTSLADALLVICEAFLAGQASAASNPEVYQVIVHVGTDVLPPAGHAGAPASDPGGQPDQTPADVSAETPAARPAGVSAETPAAARTPGHPADPARCHVEDGPAISVTTAQMLTCTAALSWMLHDRDGTVLDLGRRRRRPTSAQRRAARERDHCRCRYPGCESRRTDLHHIQYWANGGHTSLDNLINLCKRHHMLIHDRGYLIASTGGTFTFSQPDGTPLPASPALPTPSGTIEDCHDAGITPDTIIPAWYGERLDLDYAIHACFANADYQARHREQGKPQDEHKQPDQQDDHAPQAPPWQPETTELDIFAPIRRVC
jgi:5-methylcytosine-specific restriction endonuclease McrA